MFKKDIAYQFSLTSIILHWLIAVIILSLLGIGLYMTQAKDYSFYALHKSLGIFILPFISIRIFWRLFNGFPASLATESVLLKYLARISHFLLLALSFFLPLSGILMSSFGGYGLPFFGLTLLEANTDPITNVILSYNQWIASNTHALHTILGYTLLCIVIIHICAALKHHFYDKERTLLRMIKPVFFKP